MINIRDDNGVLLNKADNIANVFYVNIGKKT